MELLCVSPYPDLQYSDLSIHKFVSKMNTLAIWINTASLEKCLFRTKSTKRHALMTEMKIALPADDGLTGSNLNPPMSSLCMMMTSQMFNRVTLCPLIGLRNVVLSPGQRRRVINIILTCHHQAPRNNPSP
jgi:hypothetical protein